MYIDKANLFNKNIILRTDYNVPINNGIIQSTRRIDASLETIKFIINKKPYKIIIISHLGRPNGYDKKLSLEPIRIYLEKMLDRKIVLLKIEDTEEIKKNPFIILENIRFYKEETKICNTTDKFRKKLTNMGDVFINDAFGCCHRTHSSIIGINTSEKYLGFLVQREINYLKNILTKRGKKTLILGGSKISDKIKLIKNLIPKVDNILIGGAMAFTFMKYNNINIGKSLFDSVGFKLIPDILDLANICKTKIYLPTDYLCNDTFSNEGDIKYYQNITGIPDNYMGLDIGNETIDTYKSVLESSNIIVWNGPLGVFEFTNFQQGSKQIMEFISDLDATTIIGGGDTASCCEKFSMEDKMTHISTGGAVSLELLQGKKLPGIIFINNKV